MELETLYKTYQPHLFSIAYRMLGSVTDAEDLVQDVFLHMDRLDTGQMTNLKAYLTKTTTNRCLNFLQSARKRREIYPGPWLPEPQINQSDQPAERIVADETISYAFLVLLEQLSPVERTVFVLRESLQYDYNEIAEMIEKTEVNCRKIYSRAKQKLQNEAPLHPENAERVDHLAKTFIQATLTGNFEEFIDILTDDVVLITDGGGKVKAALNPIVTKQRVRAFINGISAKGSFLGEFHPVIVNGQRGILQVKDGRPLRVICFGLDSIQKNIQKIFIVSNPDKLKRILMP
jgi:RNA polymerase sigma-70 factor (ECF subfamily)